MLTFFDPDDRMGRREFLRVGGLTLGGLSLSNLLSARTSASEISKVLRGRSVVFLFMHGGPSQIEMFDPKMSAPSEIRSATGEIPTTIPGITFGGTFEKLAKLAHKMTVVRSFATGDDRHDIKPIVARDTFGASLGSIYARIAGSHNPVTGAPNNALLFPRAVEPSAQEGTMQFGRFDSTGTLGAASMPFIPGTRGEMQQDLQLWLPMQRLDDRRRLLERLDRLKGELEKHTALAGMERVRERAYSTILGGVAGAFDLSKEDAKTLARYDTAPLVRPDQINRKWKNYNNYVDNARSLGKLMLLARRLCERGCGFVTVTTNFVWDMHSDINNAGVKEGMGYMGVPFDHAVSAFIEDVERRGLSDKILLVCCGEMGRTPRLNANGGRDHWGNLAPLMIYGGSLKMGQVIGESDATAGFPASTPVTIRHLISSILHTVFDVSGLRTLVETPPEILQMTNWEPIPGL